MLFAFFVCFLSIRHAFTPISIGFHIYYFLRHEDATPYYRCLFMPLFHYYVIFDIAEYWAFDARHGFSLHFLQILSFLQRRYLSLMESAEYCQMTRLERCRDAFDIIDDAGWREMPLSPLRCSTHADTTPTEILFARTMTETWVFTPLLYIEWCPARSLFSRHWQQQSFSPPPLAMRWWYCRRDLQRRMVWMIFTVFSPRRHATPELFSSVAAWDAAELWLMMPPFSYAVTYDDAFAHYFQPFRLFDVFIVLIYEYINTIRCRREAYFSESQH